MPKQRITKEMILDAAFKFAREKGFDRVVIKNIADEIGCSVQPIYSYYKNMDDLREFVYRRAMEFYQSFIYGRVESDRLLESMARANVEFAKSETNLFKLLFLNKINGLNSFSDIYDWMGDPAATRQAAGRYALSEDGAKETYIMLIIFTHGMATMIAMGGANISDGEIVEFLQKAYRAFIEAHRDN